MFRFLRQLRQKLLIDNKFSKYLLLRVGEIPFEGQERI